MLVWLYYFLLLALLAGGLFLVLLTLPGLWLMAAATAGYGVLTHWRYFGANTLWTLLGASLIAEIVEVALGGAAAKKAGGGRRAMIGALIGGILGGIFLTIIPIPIISTIVGICLGSFLGAGVCEMAGGESAAHSLRVGWGAAKGRFIGLVAKLGIGAVMVLIVAVEAFPFNF